eukprot:10908992-Lingulodinium_polyedra.AAC.1
MATRVAIGWPLDNHWMAIGGGPWLVAGWPLAGHWPVIGWSLDGHWMGVGWPLDGRLVVI